MMTQRAPLTIAEIFDRAVALTVNRPGVWAFAAIPAIPLLVERAATHAAPTARESLTVYAASLLLEQFSFGAGVAAFAAERAEYRAAALAGLRWFARLVLLGFVELGVLAVAFGTPAAIVGVAWSAGGRVSGLVAAVLVAAVVLPLLPILSLVLWLAVAGVVVEEAGPVEAFRAAARRAYRGGLVRSTLLGLALAAAQTAPFLFEAPLEQFASDPAWWWISAIGSAVALVLSITFGLAITVVAARDFRVRSQGLDIGALLDAQTTA